jgi:sugar/nucleoside kinase (ribokinase family)
MGSSPDTSYDYIAVGHVTRDVIEDRPGGAVGQPGGGAFYSGLQAARLGLRTLILTQGVPAEIEQLLEPFRDEVELRVLAAEHTTTLSTRGAGSQRSQRLLAWAGPMRELPALDARILHLAPVARETPRLWTGTARFVGITPQGLVRHWEEGEGVPLVQLDAGSLLGDIPLAPGGQEALAGDISPVRLDPSSLPEHFDAAVISEHEFEGCHALFAAARRCGAYVAVTAGSRPATVHLPPETGASVVQTAQPPPVKPRDDLGAGDVFAAAFFVALSAGRTPLEAGTLANAAAAARIAGVGPGAIVTRARLTL